MLHEKVFSQMAENLDGYDLKTCGKMIFPKEPLGEEGKKA
jgi:hypothetical protein